MTQTKVTSNETDGTIIVKRQDNTTNTAPAGARIETGWGWVQNVSGSTQSQYGELVTFNTAFTVAPIVIATYGGDAVNEAPVYGHGGGVSFGAISIKASSITTTNFQITMTGGALPNTNAVYYQWIAIGV